MTEDRPPTTAELRAMPFDERVRRYLPFIETDPSKFLPGSAEVFAELKAEVKGR